MNCVIDNNFNWKFKCKHGVLITKSKHCIQCEEEKEKNLQESIKQNIINENKRKISYKIDKNIPTRYLNATFDTYIANDDKKLKILRLCQEYNFDSNLIMVGKTGTGKTHLACAILDKAFDINKSFLYIQFYKLNDIKINNKSLYGNIMHCDILVIDEYGVQDSDFKNNVLFEIINER